ncbi:TPA: hypothetical protein J1072_004401 [Escherichia coli]|nr:hypothetical protein [Escherichia coli]
MKKFKQYFSGPANSQAGFYYLILKEITVNKWRNPGGWLCAVLVLTLTTQRPFDDHTDQLWTAWLTSFQPAKS